MLEETARKLAQPLGRRLAVGGVRGCDVATAVHQHGGPDVGGQLVEIAQRELGSKRRDRPPLSRYPRDSPPGFLAGVVLICLVAALLLLINGYVGYFGILLAVAASAAVNLR